jgi:hypothetical protein
VSFAPGTIFPVAVIPPEVTSPAVMSPKSAVISTILVPSEYKILYPLSVVDHVAPVPEDVLKVTVKAPVVAFSTK